MTFSSCTLCAQRCFTISWGTSTQYYCFLYLQNISTSHATIPPDKIVGDFSFLKLNICVRTSLTVPTLLALVLQSMSSSSSFFSYLYMHFYVTDITDSYSNITCLSSINARKQQHLASYLSQFWTFFNIKFVLGHKGWWCILLYPLLPSSHPQLLMLHHVPTGSDDQVTVV